MDLKSKYFDFYDFKVDNFVWHTIPPAPGSKVKLRSLPYQINFDILTKDTSEDEAGRHLEFLIKLKLVVNPQKRPGYFIQSSFVCFFRVKNFRKLDEDVVNQYIVFTALPMSINSIRMYLSVMTARGFYGEYFLPPVDMKDLLTQKQKAKGKK